MSDGPGHPLWKAICAFSLEAVKAVLGDTIDLQIKQRGGVEYLAGRDADLQRPLTDDQITAIAARSQQRYWTDGRRLGFDAVWADVPGMTPVGAAEALRRFGLDALDEAYEKGLWQPVDGGTPPA